MKAGAKWPRGSIASVNMWSRFKLHQARYAHDAGRWVTKNLAVSLTETELGAGVADADENKGKGRTMSMNANPLWRKKFANRKPVQFISNNGSC